MIEFEPRKFAEQAWRKGFGDHPGKFGNQEVIARVHEKGVILAIRENVEKENKFTSDPTHFVIQFVMYPKPEHMAEFASNAKKAGIIGPGFSHPANEFPGSMASMRVSSQYCPTSSGQRCTDRCFGLIILLKGTTVFEGRRPSQRKGGCPRNWSGCTVMTG